MEIKHVDSESIEGAYWDGHQSYRMKISLEHIGEGYFGDFDPDNPKDAPLLRFYVMTFDENGREYDVSDGSCCTNLRDDLLTKEQRKKILKYLFDQFNEEIIEGNSIKKLAERMSWIDLTWIET